MWSRLKGKVNSDANLKELVKGSIITFILKAGGMFLSYVVVYLISEKFGKEGVGYYSLTNQLLMLVSTVATFGTTTSVLRYVGQYNKEHQRSAIRTLYALIWKIIFPLSVLIAIVGYFSADYFAIHVFKNQAYADAIRMLSIVLPLFVIDRIAIEFIRGFKQLKVSEFIRTTARPMVMTICLFLMWNMDIDKLYIVYFICLAVGLSFITSNSFVLTKISSFGRADVKQIDGKELMKVSSPMMVSAITGLLILTAPLFILEYYVSTEEVGVYSVAFKISQLITITLVVVNTIAAPKFSELYWANKSDELHRVIRQSAKLMFWSSILIALILIVGAIPILEIFGDSFVVAFWPMMVLIGGQVVNAMGGSVGLFLNMSGNQKVLRNTAFIAIGVVLILAFMLIPLYGILGASISATSGIIIWNLLCILLVERKLGFKTYYIPFL